MDPRSWRAKKGEKNASVKNTFSVSQLGGEGVKKDGKFGEKRVTNFTVQRLQKRQRRLRCLGDGMSAVGVTRPAGGRSNWRLL